jgi:hypothetical protein
MPPSPGHDRRRQNYIGYSDVLWGIGLVQRRAGRLRECVDAFERAIAIRGRHCGIDNVELLRDCAEYAAVLRELGRDDEAGRYEKAVDEATRWLQSQ